MNPVTLHIRGLPAIDSKLRLSAGRAQCHRCSVLAAAKRAHPGGHLTNAQIDGACGQFRGRSCHSTSSSSFRTEINQKEKVPVNQFVDELEHFAIGPAKGCDRGRMGVRGARRHNRFRIVKSGARHARITLLLSGPE
jgi:hypothetical protein